MNADTPDSKENEDAWMQDGSPDPPGPLFWIALACLSGVLLILTFSVLISGTWDNYRYMNLGRALHQGMGFVQPDVPGAPPETTISPGYPFLLSMIMKAAGHSRPILWMKALNTLCYWLSVIAASWILARRFRLNKWAILGFAAYLSINVCTTSFASLVFTHSPYILLSTLTIAALYSYEKSRSIASIIAAAILTAGAVYIRFPGLPLAAAGFLWLAHLRRFKAALVYAAIVGALLGVWAAPLIISGDFGYAQQLTSAGCDYPAPEYNSLFQRYFHHLQGYFYTQLPNHIIPGLGVSERPLHNQTFQSIFLFMSGGWSGIAVRLALIALIVFELMGEAWERKISIPMIFLLTYIFAISAAASYWGRYINHVLPWAVLLCGLGARRFLSVIRADGPVMKAAAAAGLAFILILTLPHYAERVRVTGVQRNQLAEYLKIQRIAEEDESPRTSAATSWTAAPARIVLTSAPWGDPKPAYSVGAYDWCGKNLPPDSVLLGCETALGSFHSELPTALVPFWWCKFGADDPRAVLPESNEWLWREALKTGATHVVMNLDNPEDYCGRHLVKAVNAFPDCFKTVFTFGQIPAAAVVLEIDSRRLRRNLIDRGVEGAEAGR